MNTIKSSIIDLIPFEEPLLINRPTNQKGFEGCEGEI